MVQVLTGTSGPLRASGSRAASPGGQITAPPGADRRHHATLWCTFSATWRVWEPPGLTFRWKPDRQLCAAVPRRSPGRPGCSGVPRTACGQRSIVQVLTGTSGPQRASWSCSAPPGGQIVAPPGSDRRHRAMLEGLEAARIALQAVSRTVSTS